MRAANSGGSGDRSAARAAAKTFCEFFAGIGLVRAGLAASGWSCLYANDVSPKKQELYEKRFGSDGHFHREDVWNAAEILPRIPGRPFLATASFPCVDLSLAGRWRGLDGAHSSSFFGFARVLEALGDRRPILVMLENVPGFITSQGGKDFESAARALADLGYRLDAFVLDARGFVPQSRPRVFLVGLHEAVDSPLMARRSARGWMKDAWTDRVEGASPSIRPARLVKLMQSIDLPTGWGAFSVPAPRPRKLDVAEVVDRDDAQDWWDQPAVQKHLDMMSDRHRREIDALREGGAAFVGTIYRRKRGGRTRAEVRFDGIAGCLRTPRGGSARQIVVVVAGGGLRMRWMSPREYARLQGAGDFPLVDNATQNLHGFGDAVCVPVVRWIDDHVLTPVFESEFERTAPPPRGDGRGGQPDSGTAPEGHAGGQGEEHVA